MSERSARGVKVATQAKRSVGRPRRLSLDVIVDAACGLGLENLDMGLLAERLNIAQATLYRYVPGREHLLQLVAQRLAKQSRIPDLGQSWQDILRQHAVIAFSLFAPVPELIVHLLGDKDGAANPGYTDNVVSLLVDRGLERETAMDLYVEVSQVVAGAAIFSQRLKAHAEDTGYVSPVLGRYASALERVIRDQERLLD